MKYDVFISYRREGGDTLAQLLYDRLTNRGYRVFLDIESLNSGKFNEKLLDVIAECKDLIIVLPPHALDRCVNEGDWVYLELAHAIRLSKNIIPVLMNRFEWPDNLPDAIAEIRNYNGIIDNKDYFDAVIDKIESLMKSKSSFVQKYIQRSNPQKMTFKERIRKQRRNIAGLFIVILAAAGVVGLQVYQKNQERKKLETEIRVKLTADEEMSASEYYDAVEILEERIKLLAGDEKYQFEVEKDAAEFVVPISVLHGMHAEELLKCYVSRPAEICFAGSEDNMSSQTDIFLLSRSDVEGVDLLNASEIGNGIDFSHYDFKGLNEGEDYKVMKIRLTDDAAVKMKQWMDLKESSGFRMYQDNLQHEQFYYYEAILKPEEQAVYFADLYQYENIQKLVQYNLSNATFSDSFYYEIQYPVKWEYEEDGGFGAYQCDVCELSENAVQLDFVTYEEKMTEGELQDTLRILKNRLDQLETPYALGSLLRRSYDISLKIGVEKINDEIADMLFLKSGLGIMSDFHMLVDPYSIESLEVQENADGTYRMEIVPDEFWDEGVMESLKKELAEEEVYLYIEQDFSNKIPLDSSLLKEAYNGESFMFDGLSLYQLESVGGDYKFIYDLLHQVVNGDELPYFYTLQGVHLAEDEMGSDFVFLEETFSEQTKQELEQFMSKYVGLEEYQVGAKCAGTSIVIDIFQPFDVESVGYVDDMMKDLYQEFDMMSGKYWNVLVNVVDSQNRKDSVDYLYSTDIYEHRMELFMNVTSNVSDEITEMLENRLNTDEFYKDIYISEFNKDSSGNVILR